MNSTATKRLKVALKALCVALLAVVVIVCGYASYFVFSFSRVGDQSLAVKQGGKNASTVITAVEYNLLSWNVGFGAYSDDYSFFMDGGKYGRAYSEQAVKDNMQGILNTVSGNAKQAAGGKFSFICYQEVDIKGTRSYNVNQREILEKSIPDPASTFAITYDCPYIAIPLNDMHGANTSGMLTLSEFSIKSAKRVEVSIEEGLYKYVDCDRCYSLNRFSVSNGKELVVINLHFSAYTSDEKIGNQQLEELIEECKYELSLGNYVICAGDFNKDLLGNSNEVFGNTNLENANWAKPINTQILEDSGIKLIAPRGADKEVASCRNADKPYAEDSFLVTVDGFLVSSNVTVKRSGVVDGQFKYSDHNPVFLSFSLN